MSPRRAPGWLVLLFGLAVATAILLTGPLLLFVPPFVSFEQSRHDVPALLATDQATVDRATRSMLVLSTALVLGFTLGGDSRAAAVMAAWAIVFSSVNWLYHYFTSLE